MTRELVELFPVCPVKGLEIAGTLREYDDDRFLLDFPENVVHRVLDSDGIRRRRQVAEYGSDDVGRTEDTELESFDFQLVLQAFRHGDDGAFGRGIDRLVRDRDPSRDGACIDDVAEPLFPHDGDGRIGPVHHAHQVQIHGKPPDVESDLLGRDGHADSRVVEDEIEVPFKLPCGFD